MLHAFSLYVDNRILSCSPPSAKPETRFVSSENRGSPPSTSLGSYQSLNQGAHTELNDRKGDVSRRINMPVTVCKVMHTGKIIPVPSPNVRVTIAHTCWTCAKGWSLSPAEDVVVLQPRWVGKARSRVRLKDGCFCDKGQWLPMIFHLYSQNYNISESNRVRLF